MPRLCLLVARGAEAEAEVESKLGARSVGPGTLPVHLESEMRIRRGDAGKSSVLLEIAESLEKIL
jgi:hypothetical protein